MPAYAPLNEVCKNDENNYGRKFFIHSKQDSLPSFSQQPLYPVSKRFQFKPNPTPIFSDLDQMDQVNPMGSGVSGFSPFAENNYIINRDLDNEIETKVSQVTCKSLDYHMSVCKSCRNKYSSRANSSFDNILELLAFISSGFLMIFVLDVLLKKRN